jgi:uncharacterized membrane protein YczE
MHSPFAPVPRDRPLRRSAQLFAGLVLYGVTAAMLVLAGLGLDPWDVLHQGLSRAFGLGIGTWAILVSFVVLLGWWHLRQRPGVGTLTNAIVVGAVIDIVLSLWHPPHALWARVALLGAGVAGNGVATGFYIGAGLGPGPRDGLSTGIAARGHSMRAVRTSIEAIVLATGFLLGGTVGIGTIFYALAIGPITHQTIPALAIGRRLSRRDRAAPRSRGITASAADHASSGAILSASIEAIASDEVAAGDGAFRKNSIPSNSLTRKSSTSVPSRPTACARTPAGPPITSRRRSAGT